MSSYFQTGDSSGKSCIGVNNVGNVDSVETATGILIKILIGSSTITLIFITEEPNIWQDTSPWIFFGTFFVIGFVHSSNKATNAVVYSLFFPMDKKVALSTLSGLDAIGKAVAFGISAHICNFSYLLSLIFIAAVATILYVIAEVIHTKDKSELEARND